MFLAVKNFKQFTALVLKLLMKNIGNLFVQLLVISLLTFRYFPQLYPFSEPEPPRFYGSGSGSGSEKTVSAAPAPAPAPAPHHCISGYWVPNVPQPRVPRIPQVHIS